jgi:hypothetical protein
VSKSYLIIGLWLLIFSFPVGAQVPTGSGSVLLKKVSLAPESVFKMFYEAGIDPVNHELTPFERAKVDAAFAALPVLHQKILGTHLHSISFMDNMPNTALTSPVALHDSTTMRYNITFRAQILHETISAWATNKENSLFSKVESSGYTVSIEAGELDAFLYVLLHEATHVVDAVLEITPHPEEATSLIKPTPFTKDVWYKMNRPDEKYIDSLLENTLFRGGVRVSICLAGEIYTVLAKMPFVSLYATASWFEDVAELETIYHLTHKMKQPFYVVVKKDNAELVRYEPMKNKLVRKRLHHLKQFCQS